MLHSNLGPTNEVVQAVAEDLLFGQENGADNSSGIAYLLALRASPDRSGRITADRRLQSACMDVSPPCLDKLMLVLACGLTCCTLLGTSFCQEQTVSLCLQEIPTAPHRALQHTQIVANDKNAQGEHKLLCAGPRSGHLALLSVSFWGADARTICKCHRAVRRP